ncbi:MAG: hypothetical protein IKW37_05350, partial [Bacteroidaceae bacterium]|nr:hypothetical protein [Bacteroidaceae bacterium]
LEQQGSFYGRIQQLVEVRHTYSERGFPPCISLMEKYLVVIPHFCTFVHLKERGRKPLSYL